MRRKGLLSFLVVVANVLTIHASAAVSASGDEYRIFDLVNLERQKMGLASLEWDGELAAVARNYSLQMAREGFFDHQDPDGNLVNDRAQRAGLNRWRRIGENLFVCQGIRDITMFAVEQWMDSPTHRSNILDRKYNATGVGIARNRNGRVYITEVFVQD